MFYRLPAIALILGVGLCGCATGAAPLYQDSSVIIRLESNPAGKADSPHDADARAVTEEQMSAVMRGLVVRRKEGLLQYVVGGRQIEPLFPTDQSAVLKTQLVKGLRQAGPDQRVAFQLSTAGPKNIQYETVGGLYLRGRLLHIVVDKFKQPARVSYEGAEYGSGKDFELMFEPLDAVIDAQGFATRWLGSYHPEIVINLRRLASGADGPDSPAVSALAEPRGPLLTDTIVARPSDDLRAPDRPTLEQLQRQIDELTRANQQLMNASAATQQELSQVRQELAETKQVLADKVMELNKLKGKSKPKASTPAPR